MNVAYGYKQYNPNGPHPDSIRVIGAAKNKSAENAITLAISYDQPFSYNNQTKHGSGFFFCCGGAWGARLAQCDTGDFDWQQLPRSSVLSVSRVAIHIRLTRSMCPEDSSGSGAGFPYWFGYGFDNVPFGASNFGANIYAREDHFNTPGSLWR